MVNEPEDKFSGSFYASPISMAISSINEGRLLEVNTAFERNTGYRPDEVIGRTSIELGLWHDPRERHAIVKLLEIRREISNRIFTLRDKNGECHSALFSCVIIEHDGEKRLLKMMHIISPQDVAKKDQN